MAAGAPYRSPSSYLSCPSAFLPLLPYQPYPPYPPYLPYPPY
jgi:hypothetical protein